MEYETYDQSDEKAPQLVVSQPYRVAQSFAGKYFIGHTPNLPIRRNAHVWGALVNPPDSGVDVFLNTFTVSNTSGVPMHAELWLNAAPYGTIEKSTSVSVANTAFRPAPTPLADLTYASRLRDAPATGVSILTRIVEANSTAVGNYYGKIIVPPGGSILVFVYMTSEQQAKAEIAMGWWENKT